MLASTKTQKLDYKKVIIETIAYAYIILFVYAAMYKLFDIPFFQRQLAKSPLIGDWSILFSYTIPTLELLLAVLIFWPKTKWYGLVGGTALMWSFTVYIAYILNFSPDVPCSCGGVLATMGWRDHLIFNSLYVVAGLTALWLTHSTSKRK